MTPSPVILADGLFWHRGQFALTITFHYLFPPLTMALAVLIAILKGMGLWKGDERYHECARF